MFDIADLTRISPVLDSRSVSFENPTGERGAGGGAGGGRKGAPNRELDAGERVTLADLRGPGTLRHLWMTFPPGPPERTRAMCLEIFYDDMAEPSVSVPCVDFFGVPHGRPVPLSTAVTTIQEGRGFNSYLPVAFGDRVRVEFVNGSEQRTRLYYQIDYTAGEDPAAGRLHAAFRRQNPTTLRDDFVIADGLRGPGRFLGCVVGVRPLDPGTWYGEGEVKIFRDGDGDRPTICGTGLEDHVGTAWGMGRHTTPYQGVPLNVHSPDAGLGDLPDFVGLYRWHIPDPVMFTDDLRVTCQQIGSDFFFAGEHERLAAVRAGGRVTSAGVTMLNGDRLLAVALVDRVDDYCATAFTVCATPQPVPRVDVPAATANLARTPYESPDPLETIL